MKKDQDHLFAGAMLVSGLILFFLIMARSLPAAGKLAEGYRYLKEADLSGEVTGTVFYDDGLYGVIGFGIENDPADPAREEVMASFLENSLGAIRDRVLACGVMYTMIASSFFAYHLYLRYREDRKRHTASVLSACLLVFLLYAGTMAFVFSQNGLPAGLPPARSLFLLAVCLVSLAGGACALALLVRMTRFKKTVSLLAVPAVFVLFLFSFPAEAGLYSEKLVDSFEYVFEADPRLRDENFTDAYYDEDRNVLVVEEKEYAPEQTENPDHIRGSARAAAYVFEALDPYSGHSLFMLEQALGTVIKPGILSLYLLKGMLWILAALCFPGKKKRLSA